MIEPQDPIPPEDSDLLQKIATLVADYTTPLHVSDADLNWIMLEIMAAQAAAGKLEAAQQLGVHLAAAIISAQRSPKALTQALGLGEKRGRKTLGPRALAWGAVVCAAEDAGVPPEMALDATASALAKQGEALVDRTSLQRWRDAARAAFFAKAARK